MSFLLRLCFLLVIGIGIANAGCYPLTAQTKILGALQFTKIQAGDNFTKLAQRYDVGYDQIQAANPRLDSEKPLLHAAVVIPSQYIIPQNVAHRGIVINLAQMRLFYFPSHQHRVCTYPIGIGRKGWQTPKGQLFIAQKIKNPIWVVPDSIMKYRKERGDPVPKVMPSGPKNPLGYFAMRLSLPTYLIHGTDDPSSIGRRGSAGCIHLFRADIKKLFAMTPVKTSVHVIDEPYLFARIGEHLYLEANPPLIEMQQLFASQKSLQQAQWASALHDQLPMPEWERYRSRIQQVIGTPTGVVYRLV